jgi:Rps23 Pro-64 3,4-dihydroxylase Tpa1-like proline 4-hydroxylase
MEVNETQLNNYLRIYDNFLPDNVHQNFLKYVESLQEFSQGKISGDKAKDLSLKKNIRDVFTFDCINTEEEKSFTNIHWTNFLLNLLTEKIKNYFLNFNEYNEMSINTLQILKYNVGGHYKLHSDNCHKFPRSLSFIYLINDNYEGGDLVFATPISLKEIQIQRKKNTLVVWPSNFLYPHTVTRVTKGVRYSAVAWAS